MRHLIFLVVWAAILNPVALWAAGDTVSADRSLHVTSDTMISERDAAFVEFVGNAKATSQNSVVHADSIKVFLYKDEEKKKLTKKDEQNIKEILATGNVRFISGDRKAFAEKAIFTTVNQTLILTGGSPKVITGESYVTGKKIILFQKDGRVVVESGKEKRVEAQFNSNDRLNRKEDE